MPLTKEMPPKGDGENRKEVDENIGVQEDINGQEEVIKQAKRILNPETVKEPVAKNNEFVEKRTEEKRNSIREKIMKLFKAKTISEIKDPEKLKEILKDDLLDLNHIASYSTGVGGVSIEAGGNYKNMAEKYEMGEDGEKLTEKIIALKKEIGKTEDAVALQAQFNEQHRMFLTKMRENGEKRILELSK
ncbi:MAG TPA: hypothetical protein PKZ36_02610 [Candidatus Paceibacterota bacterium]|nr:hypothetical protein [Candidatus Paceibacterota bacterium]HPT18270.1 hypothetical protein [Candidatus Paceibacterota bacterium]